MCDRIIPFIFIEQAVHFVSKNHEGEKICEVLLNLINCLLDLDIVERQSDTDKMMDDVKTGEDNAEQLPTENGKSEMSAYDLAMDSLIRSVVFLI